MRGLVVVALALWMAGCATSRDALLPARSSAPTTTPVRVVHRGPVTARQLARRLGLTYADGADHVLLTDRYCRVRIWKDSNEVSVAGRSTRMQGRTRRRAGGLVIPGPMASHVETKVGEQRGRFTARPRRRPVVVVQPPMPLPPAPKPAPTPTAKPQPVTVAPPPRAADPAWEARGAAPREWRWIVIHHSDDTRGNLAKYDIDHRENNGWDECGYHFVIGNGSLSGDGQVEVGSRWFKQKHGAHCKTSDNCFNDHGVGVCLVGDFETGGRPTRAQMNALVTLCRYLMERHGISASEVVGHNDCKATACPGRHFPWAELRSRLAR